MTKRRRLICLGAVVIVTTLSFLTTHAALFSILDLDSLVHLSPQIVEGNLYSPGGTNIPTAIKISEVYKGVLKLGEIVTVTNLAWYRKTWKNTLQDGDNVFLFLIPYTSYRENFPHHSNPGKTAPEKAIFCPVESGVRLVISNNVFGFHQDMNPGPALVDTPAILSYFHYAIRTVAEFRHAITEAIPRVDEREAIVNHPATTNDIPDRLTILRQRLVERRSNAFGFDVTSQQLCESLARTQDPKVIFSAMDIVGERKELRIGLGTPEGHLFLLDKIAGEKVPHSEKMRCADLLSTAGEGETNEYQIQKIAKLALHYRNDEPLMLVLLNSLKTLAEARMFAGIGNNYPAMDKCRKAAFPVLSKLAKQTKSPEAKKQIERIFWCYGEGSATAKTCYVHFDDYAGSNKTLRFTYSKRTGYGVLQGAILENKKTGQRWTIPSITHLNPDESDGECFIVVPNEVSLSGRYNFYLQFKEDGKISNTENYFEVDL